MRFSVVEIPAFRSSASASGTAVCSKGLQKLSRLPVTGRSFSRKSTSATKVKQQPMPLPKITL